MPGTLTPTPWWRRAVLYQIYLRSFQDTTGSGVGDLNGVRQRLDHLVALGVDTLWLSPVHPSPNADFGYDVADYIGVDPSLGTLADLDALVADAHSRGLRVLLDGVFNHTSDQHPWFVSSRDHPAGPHADFYLWRDGQGGDRAAGRPGRAPNNWGSTFGGPAWTWSPARGQWYLHSFAAAQPDLNWRCPAVVDQVLASMEFWLQRGIDGFRLDVFNCYRKHPDLPDNPRRLHPAGPLYPFIGQHHVHDRDQADLPEVLAPMRSLADRHDAVLVGETLDERFVYDNAAPWVGPDRLHLAFHFGLLHARWGAKHFAGAIARWISDLGPEGWPTWVVSNHDFVRAAGRWGQRDDRMRLVALMLGTLRGTPVVYYGDEVGLREAKLPRAALRDPVGQRFWPFYKGRDGARTPMPWTSGPQGGFTTGTPWLPTQPDAATRCVSAQRAQPGSVLRFWKQVLALRKRMAVLVDGQMSAPWVEGPLLCWERSLGSTRVRVVLNMGDRTLRRQSEGPVLLATPGGGADALGPCSGRIEDLG